MQIIKYKDILSKRNKGIIKEIIANDGVIVYPTDTLYGLGGNFFSSAVIEKIDTVKNRRDNPYSVMVPGMKMIYDLVDYVPGVFHKLYRELLPGKFTFLFRVSPSVDPALVKGSDRIGIRIPHVPGMLKLLEFLGIPLVSTSVNRSGQPALNGPAAILREFSNPDVRVAPGLLIDAGVLPSSRGSTILDLTRHPIQCIRQGDDFEKWQRLL